MDTSHNENIINNICNYLSCHTMSDFSNLTHPIGLFVWQDRMILKIN